MIGPNTRITFPALFGGKGISIAPIEDTPAGQLEFIETELPNGKTVRRVVRSYKEGGGSATPANYNLTPGNGKVIHKWDEVADADGYRIYDADNEPPVKDDESASSGTEEATPNDNIGSALWNVEYNSSFLATTLNGEEISTDLSKSVSPSFLATNLNAETIESSLNQSIGITANIV